MKTAYLVAGLAFGDEGKGSIVDYLARKHQSSLIIRYNGGPQAAHNVVTPDGRHHTFSQFGSGMFVPECRTHLSRFMLVNPLNMMCEEEHLRAVGIDNAWSRTTIDEDCIIITPYHKAANRIIEKSRGDKRHGSCGQGIGTARWHYLQFPDSVLYARDLRGIGSPNVVREKLEAIRQLFLSVISSLGCKADPIEAQVILDPASVEWTLEQYQHFPLNTRIIPSDVFWHLVDANNTIIFEGAQGMMIDEKYGTAPHNTWTDCTFTNAETLLNEAWRSDENTKIIKLGVLRSYYTRHGAGPFPTEDERLNYPEIHNGRNEYQGAFRLGSFDYELAKYAIEAIKGVDYLAINHLDENYPTYFHNVIEEKLGLRIMIEGQGPTSLDKAYTNWGQDD